MILTCPACSTKYVVKDGAIPAGGRQVRCASCKHSWHQDPEEATAAVPMQEAETGVAEAAANIVEPPAFPTTDTPNPLDQIVADVPPAPGPPPLTEDRQWQPVEPASPWDEPAPVAEGEPSISSRTPAGGGRFRAILRS